MFIFNGISSKDMSISCKDEDFIGRASKVYEQTTIEGKDGSSFEELSYSNYEKSITMYLKDISKIDDVFSWLNGEGIFEYDGRKTKAWFLDEIETENQFDRIIILKTKFVRYPFWEAVDDDYIQVTTAVTNRGNACAYPVIKLSGTGWVDISINDVRFTYNFDEDGQVEIDCLNMEETYKGISKAKNIEIGFEYPKLFPGKNTITINSGSCMIFIKRKDRWL